MAASNEAKVVVNRTNTAVALTTGLRRLGPEARGIRCSCVPLLNLIFFAADTNCQYLYYVDSGGFSSFLAIGRYSMYAMRQAIINYGHYCH